MKYYVESLKKFFDTAEEADKAEKKYLAEVKAEEEKKAKLADERKARADEVDAAFKAVAEAQEKARKLLNDFCKDYGAYHHSYKIGDAVPSLFDWMLKDWLVQ